MPLLGLSKKKKGSQLASTSIGGGDDTPGSSSSYGVASYRAHPAATEQSSQPSSHQPSSSVPPPSSVSKTGYNICGLPVTVYGLSSLTPSSSRSSAPNLPPVCISIHLHGRGGSAETDDDVCRGIYEHAQRESQRRRQRKRELLVVSFDARNHGHRLTNEVGQKGWSKGNDLHAMDLYSSILGTSSDVSFLIDFLPSYLFPQDDRIINKWCVTGKSMGGHCVYHLLKDDKRVSVGVSMIGMPDMNKLLEFRTKQAFVRNGPPYVPQSLKDLIKVRDPANVPYDRMGTDNPYWGKKLMALSGAQDKLVHPSFSRDFLARIMVSEPSQRDSRSGGGGGGGGSDEEQSGWYQQGLKVKWYEGCKHIVTPEMIEEAGKWIGKWGICD
ncbi:unnamed protein product [Sympodiomycopsis kandeliae]